MAKGGFDKKLVLSKPPFAIYNIKVYMSSSRDYKISAENTYYHIYNRGNRKEDIFLEDEDFNFFLLRLKQNINPQIARPRRMQTFLENSFSLIAYSLLPNHFHFILRQNKDVSPSRLVQKIATSYSKHFNKKYEKVGHVFQDAFRQKIIDNDSYLKWLSAYIHQNPCLHGLTNSAQKYKWSSYGEYLNPSAVENICEIGILNGIFGSIPSLIEFTESNLGVLKQNKAIKEFCYE